MSTLGQRLRSARVAANKKQREIAALFGIDRVNVTQWESDTTRPEMDRLGTLADFLGVSVDWLLTGEVAAGKPELEQLPPSNARMGPKVYLGETGERIPVYGQAVGGDDGRFVLNGNRVGDVLMPPVLYGVPDAYAVYVSGDSMEPRYEAGEVVYVHPYLPVRRDDYVVVQIALDEHEPPAGYIKRFVSMSGDTLRLRQFNPAKDMHFPRARVVSVHKIVGSGI